MLGTVYISRLFKFLVGIALLIGLGIFLAPPAEALTISPVRVEVAADPGETYTGEYRLTNDTENTRTYYNSFQNFRAEGETGTPFFIPEDVDLASWLDGPETVTLAPYETRNIPFSITVPADAEPGGYFSAIFWVTQPVNASGQTVSFRLGMLVFLRVNGDVTEDGGIIEFGGGKSFTTQTPLDFFYRFQNDGNDRLLPKGMVTIKGLFGKTAAELDANAQLGNVLPFSKRRFALDWIDDDRKADRGVPQSFFQKAGYQFRNFHIGPYTATLDLTYGVDGQLSDQANTHFFVLPIQALIILLVILVVLYIGYRIMRRAMRRAVEQKIGDRDALKDQLRKEILAEEAAKEKKK